MATTPTVLRNAVDSAVSSKYPTKNFGNPTKLGIRGTVGWLEETFIFFAAPFPKGATIINATLSIVSTNAYTGSVTWNVSRLASGWSASRITWNTRPIITGSPVAVTKSAPGANTQWDFDLTAMMQTISNGAAWYGVKVWTTHTQANWIWSSENPTPSYRPVLSISWSDNPKAPTMLYPSGGRAVSVPKPVLQCNFVDVSGDTTMQSLQVQIDDTSDFATPLFDSGVIATSVPELNLAATAFAGLSADQVVYWRARVQDGVGLWSNWSVPTTFTYITRGTLTLVNPAASPNNFVAEATPPIDWTFTGRTQRAYQIIVAEETNPNFWLWNSGKITSTVTNVTLPDRVLVYNTRTYRITLQVWDTIDREATPGDPIPTVITRTFTYQYDATVDPVTGLTATLVNNLPHVRLDWARTTQPDFWNIYRDGIIIANVSGTSLFTTGTSYQYWDYAADPKTQHTYTVIAVVNGKGSTPNPTVNATPKLIGPTLAGVDGLNPVILFNTKDFDMSLSEESAIFAPAAAGAPIVITQAERGYQGSLSGVLASFGGISADTFRDRYKKLIRNNGQVVLLSVVNETFQVILQNATIRPLPRNEEIVYLVSFNFYQTDFVP